MAFNRLTKPRFWLIKLNSRNDLTDANRDFIAELVSEEALKAIKPYSFILDEMIESKKYCKIFIEGTRVAVNNLVLVLKDNLQYKISHISYI